MNDTPGFDSFGLHKLILRRIKELGYEVPTPVQELCIPILLEGKDVVASAQTGTGKTAAFILPIIHRFIEDQDAEKRSKKIRSLILCPTRELAMQIAEATKQYCKYTNLRTGVVYGGTSMQPQIDMLKKGVDILVATPGRLLDLRKRNLLKLDRVEVLVFDEADLMLDMGFIDEAKKIERMCPREKQNLLFSATMPEKVVTLAKETFHNPERISVTKKSSPAIQVKQQLYYVPKPKKVELCLHLLRNTIKGKVIVFRRTKFGVDKLEKSLLKNGYKVAAIHGDKSQNQREEAIQLFKDGQVNILIGTDVASRGIDIKNVDGVVNFDMPNVPEIYIHRIGRTGRAGEEGMAYSFCSDDEISYVTRIQKLMSKLIPLVEDHPYKMKSIDFKAIKSPVKSKYKKGRKSAASRKKKKRWY